MGIDRIFPAPRAGKASVAILAAAIGALSVLSFNANAGLFDDDEARKDIKNLRAQTEQQSRDNDAKFQKLDESIKNIGIIQLLNQIEQLNAEIARLRGQVEVLANQNDQVAKRQKDFYLDLDTRIRKLEGVPADGSVPASSTTAPSNTPAALPQGSQAGGQTGSASSPTPVSTSTVLGGGIGAVTQPTGVFTPTTAQSQGARPGSAVNRDQENKAYDVGSNLFRRGDFVGAIRAFETFTKDYPTNSLVPNAQYWMGISYYNLKDFQKARSTQESLVRNFPDSTKTADAMLAIASIQIESGDNGSGRNTLEDIVARYPNSEAATKARSRLALFSRR